MLIIGLGNEFRGDDALGIRVIESLRTNHPQLGEYIVEQSDLSRLLYRWKGEDVVLVDAVASSKLEPGSLCISSSYSELMNMRDMLFSTHGLDLGHLLALGKQINKLPKSLYFIGVVGHHWTIGNPLSKEVKQVLFEVRKRIVIHVNAAFLKGTNMQEMMQ